MHPFHLPFPRGPRALVITTAPRPRRAGPRHSAFRHALRLAAFGTLVVVAIAGTAGAAWLLAGGDPSVVAAALSLRSDSPLTTQSRGAAAIAGGVPLQAATSPANAQVLVDGHAVGTTPLVTAVQPGPHQLTLRRNGALDATRELDVPTAGTALDVALWRTQPTAVKLRPAYPGAAIADAQFLVDGRIALVLLLPISGGAVSGQRPLREAWLLDPASGRLDAFAPSIRAAVLAVSPDGGSLAYLQQAPPQPGQAGAGAPPPITGRVDEVWVATQGDGQPLRRIFQLPPPERASGYGTTPVEQLADLAWAPDGRHLLVATRIGQGGDPSRARLLVLDTEDTGAAPRELITMPAEPVPGSYSWSADGSWVAFEARAASAPAGKGLVTLVAVRLADDGAPDFRYMADLAGSDSSSAPPLPVTPVAWEPVTPDDGADARLLYTAPVPAASSSGGLPDLGSVLGFRGPAAPPSGLFLVTPAAPDLATDDQRRVGSAVGLIGPVWLPPAVGPAAGPVLALARTNDNGGQLVLRAMDLASGRAQDTGSRLPPGVGSRSAPGVRWEPTHGQALLLTRASTATHGIASAGNSPDLDVWLVQFAQPQEPGA